MFFRGICYGCAVVCGVSAIHCLTQRQPVAAAFLAAAAFWNYYLGGKKK